MTDIYQDGKGQFIVNLSDRNPQAMKDRAKLSEYSGIDLASGFPKSLIWVCKDGRKIAIPNLTDSHLLNIIAFLIGRAPGNKRKMALEFMLGVAIRLQHFDHVSDHEEEYIEETVSKEVDKIVKMSDDAFLRKVYPIYTKLLEECYKRKLVPDHMRAIKKLGSPEDEVADLHVDPSTEEVVRQPSLAKAATILGKALIPQPKPKKPKKVRKPTAIERIKHLKDSCDSFQGIEVHKDQWADAEALLAKYPEYRLSIPRGPDKAWKRLMKRGFSND